MTPRLNKVYVRREKFHNHNNKSQKSEIVSLANTINTLKNDLLDVLRKEFKESVKDKRKFSFDMRFNNPLDKVLLTTSNLWNPTSYVSSGSFNMDKNFTENNIQRHHFMSNNICRVNRLEL